jgi:hypothetical protein
MAVGLGVDLFSVRPGDKVAPEHVDFTAFTHATDPNWISEHSIRGGCNRHQRSEQAVQRR